MNASTIIRAGRVALAAVAIVAMTACSSSKKVTASIAPLSGPPAMQQAGGVPAAGGAAVPASGSMSPAGASVQTQVATVQAGSGGASAGPSALSARTGGASLLAPRDSERIVYFDYDSFVLREEARPIIEAQARRLMTDRSRRLVIEGHADERGSHEYNLALGQKRADAVLRALTLVGAPMDQLEAVSFGEERPAMRASNDEAWAKNRRVELNDRR